MINDQFLFTQAQYKRAKRLKVWGGISLAIVVTVLTGFLVYGLAVSAGAIN